MNAHHSSKLDTRKFKAEREALGAASDEIATLGFYTNYIQGQSSPCLHQTTKLIKTTGICKGREWEPRPRYVANPGGKGCICVLTVYGSGLFCNLDPKQVEGREFYSEPKRSPDAALEDAAHKAYELLDNLTNNEKRGRLPPYDYPAGQHRQGRRASSSSSSDSGSSGDDSTRSQRQGGGKRYYI